MDLWLLLYMGIVFFLLRWGSSCIILCNIGTNLICIYISWKIGLHFLLCGEIWLLFVGSKIDALIPGIIKIVTRVLGLHFELWLWFVINGNPLKLSIKTETDFQDKNPSTYYIFMPDKSGVKIKASKFFL